MTEQNGVERSSATDKLKPCPFCGGEAYLNKCPHCGELNIEVEHKDGCWLVEWDGAYDVEPSEHGEYVAAWNRRADERAS